MVLLIGGVSCCGKTLAAQRLVEKYSFPCTSLDHLKMGLIRGLPDCPFGAEDGDDFIAEKLWGVTRGIIMTAVENNQNLILEGCYLPPEKVAALPANYRRHVAAIYIIFSREYVMRHFEDGLLAHLGDIETRLDESRSAQWFACEHEKLKARCIASGARFFEVTDDYTAGLAPAYKHIDCFIKSNLSSVFKP